MRTLFLCLICSATVVVPGTVLFACGGTSVTAGGDAGSDSFAIDSTTQDTGTSMDTGTPVDSGAPPDTGVVDTGTGDTATGCSAMMPKAACQACCARDNPEGGTAFFSDLLMCACKPEFCGPIDGGAPEGGAMDGGVAFGQGDCTQAECSGTTVPRGKCLQCGLRTLQADAGGTCGTTVIGQCFADPACQSFVACETSCK